MNLRFLLYPFALIYKAVILIRNFLFDTGAIAITGFEYPIISVGNLSVGGTGKTPHVEYLIRLLRSEFKVATMSRGYGRKSKGFIIIKQKMHITKAGDEPLQYKHKFPEVKVTVCEKRVKGMMSLLASFPDLNAIILDDAFQHRSIKPGLSIVLTDYKNPYYNDYLLPVGTLRDTGSSIRRAHMIIVTKTPEEVSSDSLKRMRSSIKLLPHQSIFFTCIRYGSLNPVWEGFPALNPGELKGYHIIAFSGLARPGNFVGFLKSKSLSLTHIRFSDHYIYSERELRGIAKRFRDKKGDPVIIVTTEKDWMRIINEPTRKVLEGIPVYTLEIFVDFLDPKEKEIFDRKILSYVEKNQPNRIYNRKQDRV